MTSLFPNFDPDGGETTRRPRRLRAIPVRMIVPNAITLLALCAGLTAIRMTIEGRFEIAVYAVLVAAVLDGLDGRIARYLKSTSKFGAELDSLSDFVSFGVAPAILMFGWVLHQVKSFGWLAAMVFAIAAALRLARFNVASGAPKPDWQSNFFTGVPAPAGALTVLLPIYLDFSGLDVPFVTAHLAIGYVIVIALLMVSRIPTFSGKKLGRIRRDLVLPLLVALVVFVGLIVSFPFEMLAALSLVYLATIPLGWRAWNRQARAHGAREEEIGFDAPPDEVDADPLDDPKAR